MLMRQSTHDAIVAAKDAELGEQKKLSAKVFASNLRLARENADLRARLAVFTAPRQRDASGRYQPTSRKGKAA